MTTLNRMLVATCLTWSAMALAGCGGNDLSPADPSQVPKVDPATIEKALSNDQSKKYMPKGAKIPSGAVPETAPEK